ncbi:MAG: hypothetical protein LBM73_01860 [Candidatus Nomurabacteria bacterium]|nr:hypothetical protein [Candidatus Nomurabacteria bacterium]
MKKFGLILAICLLALTGGSGVARAAGLTMTQTAAIRANCHSALTSLQQISRADAAGRINRGRGYDDILKLMYAFNARVAANKISAPTLSQLTDRAEKATDHFRADYDDYESDLENVLGKDCGDDPAGFYDQLETARAGRAKVHSDIGAIDQIIRDYDAAAKAISPSEADDGD